MDKEYLGKIIPKKTIQLKKFLIVPFQKKVKWIEYF